MVSWWLLVWLHTMTQCYLTAFGVGAHDLTVRVASTDDPDLVSYVELDPDVNALEVVYYLANFDAHTWRYYRATVIHEALHVKGWDLGVDEVDGAEAEELIIGWLEYFLLDMPICGAEADDTGEPPPWDDVYGWACSEIPRGNTTVDTSKARYFASLPRRIMCTHREESER